MDFAEAGTEIETTDVVVLNRVICCYQYVPQLAIAAAERAGSLSDRGLGWVSRTTRRRRKFARRQTRHAAGSRNPRDEPARLVARSPEVFSTETGR
jgi:hypothetical protein